MALLQVQCIWNFCVISVLLISQISCDQLFNFGLKKNVCEMECQCYSWKSTSTRQEYDRFTVNCTGMKFGLFQGLSIPNPLPFNTTDLLVNDYMLGTLSIKSFDNNAFPLNPQLITLALHNCHIRYVSHETFYSNSLQSLHHIDLANNMLEILQKDMFSFLNNVKSISVAHNHIEEVGSRTFRNLNQIKVINMSHNWLKKLNPEVFHKVPNLEILDLSHNWLQNLPWENISQLLSLKELGLKGNFWDCSCKMKSILKLNQSLVIGTKAKCQNPQELNGTLLEDLTSEAFSSCFSTKDDPQIKYAATLLCIIMCLIFLYGKYMANGKKPLKTLPEKLSITRAIKVEKPSETHIEKPFETASEKPSKTLAHTSHKFKLTGRIGRNVYRGELDDGQEAAFKKHDSLKEASKELRLLIHLSKEDRLHPNVIHYICIVSDPESEFLVLELCDGDLMTAVMEQISGFCDIVDPQNYFLQLISAICFLHKLGIQHRDIKPQNILWKRTVDDIKLILSDLDKGHFCREKSSHQMCGTIGWISPEMYLLKETRSNAVDIFPLGCVFYFILTRAHPFGDISFPAECQQNIINPEHKVSLDLLYDHFNHNMHLATMTKDLIERMICSRASDRIEDNKLIKHPCLLKKTKMKRFLSTIGDYVDVLDDPNVIDFKEKLEENSNVVFDGKWLDKLDKCVRTDLSGFSKTGSDKICCLLRAIRNKMLHFQKLRKVVRDTYLGSEFGVIEYYTKRFPKLVTYTYDVLERSNIENFAF